jgi:hypothetical protein
MIPLDMIPPEIPPIIQFGVVVAVSLVLSYIIPTVSSHSSK